MKKIAHFGAYDHSSYGDLLFPKIVEYFLPDFQVIHVAPTAISAGWSDASPIIGVAEALGVSDWDGVLVGGGDIVQSGVWSTEKWMHNIDVPFCGLPSIWVGACFLSAKLNIPLAWNAPGVPHYFPESCREIVDLALESSDYIAVRDSFSAERLAGGSHTRRAAPQEISVVPDSAILMNRVWPGGGARTGALAISLGRSDAAKLREDVCAALDLYKQVSGRGCISALQLMPWDFEGEDYEKFLLDRHIDVSVVKEFSISVMQRAIASSDGYIGNSLHGLVTAISYGVPAVLIPPHGRSSHKYEGFLRAIGLDVEMHIAPSWREAVDRWRVQAKCGPIDLLPSVINVLETHWGRVRDTLSSGFINKRPTWDKLGSFTRSQGLRLAELGMSVDFFCEMTRASLRDKDVAWENRLAQTASDYQIEINRIGFERDTMLADRDLAWENRVEQVAADYRNEIFRISAERDEMIARIYDERDAMLVDKDLAWGSRVEQVAVDYRNEILRIGGERDVLLGHVQRGLPLVSLIIVNYNGLRFLPGLLGSLFELDYPNHEVILVDNASVDASLDFVEMHYPQVRVVRSTENLGFAGGNNLGMRHSRGELIGLVNNDAEVDRQWLRELVRELMSDQAIWVAGSKIVFFREYIEVRIRSSVFRPAQLGISHDTRNLGLLLDEVSAFVDCDYHKPVFASGFYAAERHDDRKVRWTNGDARLFLPVMPGQDWRDGQELLLRFAGTTGGAGGEFCVEVGGLEVASGHLSDSFQELRIPIAKDLIEIERFQLINNAGTRLDEHGNAGDRGIYEPDKGQFDRVEDMPALCGAAMLFKRRALERVGLFDSDFFMYYEDTDLCWRISKLGGVLRYVPTSVIRHIHTGSSVEWSPHFLFHVARNHVLIRVKHAALRTAVRGYLVELYRCMRSGWFWLRHDRGRLGGQGFREFRLRLKIQRSLLALMPAAFLKRYGWRTAASDVL